MKPKGIVYKTFMFTTALITLAGLISFGILYAVLPGYYEYKKNRSLNRNADALVAALAQKDADGIKNELALFCRANNTTVTAFDADDMPLPEFSYPLVMMDDEVVSGYTITINMLPDSTAAADDYSRQFFTHGAAVRTDRTNMVFRISSPLGTVLTRPVNSDIISRISIVATLQPVDEARGVVLSLIPYLLALNIVIALAAAYFYSRRLTRPIIRLSDTAARMQQLTPGITSGITTDDELGLLSRNLDSLYLRFNGALAAVNEEMDKVSRMERSKTDFMRAASHELKTPLAALNGITEGMLDRVGVYTDRERYLNESKRLIDRMTLLVDEILNASKLEYLGEDITPEDVEPGELLSALIDDYAIEIADKRLNVEYARTHAVVWHTDRTLIRAALSNVLSNAVRYTEPGGRIIIALTEREVSIENECEGIADEHMPRVFEPFYVLDYSRSRSVSGTGIGLFIVKKNLEALGLPFELANTELGVRFRIGPA